MVHSHLCLSYIFTCVHIHIFRRVLSKLIIYLSIIAGDLSITDEARSDRPKMAGRESRKLPKRSLGTVLYVRMSIYIYSVLEAPKGSLVTVLYVRMYIYIYIDRECLDVVTMIITKLMIVLES